MHRFHLRSFDTMGYFGGPKRKLLPQNIARNIARWLSSWTSRNLVAVAAGVMAFSATQSQAALLFTIQPVGSDVVVTGSGSAITTGLTVANSAVPSPASIVISPKFDVVAVGSFGSAEETVYFGVTGPSSFGTGGSIGGFSGTGSRFGLDSLTASQLLLEVPQGYVSGTALSGTATYTGSTFATLGVTPGTYVYNFGSGPTADTLTIHVVPEPASLGTLAVVAGTFLLRRRRRGQALPR